MDSEDEIGIDSGNVSSDEDYDFMQVDEIQRSGNTANEPVDYPFEVLTTEEIVQHMLDCIKEVNNVVEVSSIAIEGERNFIIIIGSSRLKFFSSVVVVTSITLACRWDFIRQSNSLHFAVKGLSIVITNKIAREKKKTKRFRRLARTIFKHF